MRRCAIEFTTSYDVNHYRKMPIADAAATDLRPPLCRCHDAFIRPLTIDIASTYATPAYAEPTALSMSVYVAIFTSVIDSLIPPVH